LSNVEKILEETKKAPQLEEKDWNTYWLCIWLIMEIHWCQQARKNKWQTYEAY